ncbi:hypothetical protein [Mycobacterium sp. NAZ190054]|uniref:hypothetical protein n=1 Tax=Mycobacterium sp. NAZ190054 TaxID=1747766 RepID=UPI0007990719|nr:hypothetical protein [Mycobacterium sp. NAZ190054]KWX56879.1 hypothetical protein ASJ79_13100 [Mycobacterium sp. NAZ190054]
MRDLDDLLADIDSLEADEPLQPLPGESEAEFKRRMLAEFDALNAEEDSADPDPLGWDAWRWTPDTEPDPEPVSAAQPSYLLEEWEISSVMPRGGPLTVSIGGRRLGTLNPAAV